MLSRSTARNQPVLHLFELPSADAHGESLPEWRGCCRGPASGIRGRLKPNRTSHLEGARPHGGNIVFLDGHTEWRRFPRMVARTTGEPDFWW